MQKSEVLTEIGKSKFVRAKVEPSANTEMTAR